MENLLKKHIEKFRFILVGIANTILDFGVLFLLVHFGVNKIIANYFSTGLSFIFSFFMNKSFTFKDRAEGNIKRQFSLFVVVSITGLWILQPIIIWLTGQVITSWIASEQWQLLIEKLIATAVSLCWNYVLYSRFVFKK